MPEPGTFIGVVGPSGAGKDSLLNFAKSRFAANPQVEIVRRYITRPADGAGNEDHVPIGVDAFAKAASNGEFALSWTAHGLSYGIPVGTCKAVASGHTVIANLSRSVIEQARALYPRSIVIAIAVDPDVLRARLLARGRETPEQVEARLKRTDFSSPREIDLIVENNDSLTSATERFYALIDSVRQDRRAYGA